MGPRPLDPDEPERIGDYRLTGVLGQGGQGVVYLGEASSGGRVAIKVLHRSASMDAESRRRFLREADTARRVAPFCTARVLDVGDVHGRPYVVSEYIPGGSLAEAVATDGPRTGSGLQRLAVATLTALTAIHRAGIVHRDFKPGNVILGPEGPVVIDFGIARSLDHATTESGVVGTPAYIAPEQFAGQPPSRASDVFSWACTMAFAATGRLAFGGATIPALLYSISTRDPDLAGVPGDLRPLLAACLNKDPGARPTAADLLRDLTGNDPHPPLPPEPAGPDPSTAIPTTSRAAAQETAQGTAGDAGGRGHGGGSGGSRPLWRRRSSRACSSCRSSGRRRPRTRSRRTARCSTPTTSATGATGTATPSAPTPKETTGPCTGTRSTAASTPSSPTRATRTIPPSLPCRPRIPPLRPRSNAT
ncbi:serine/threonine-protein kinase [Nonomuraea sp. NPDC026600]|uniref:serine/threonine-protein kinase n=1 Tax=Nonomuraea sp. NPDC026600 TaxID=3155363 RepID=UPI0033C76FCE